MTKGIEDAFVNMAKTGKLSFSSLIDTMLEDFLRWEIKVLESQAIKLLMGDTSSGSSGGGGLLGMLGINIPKFASGGYLPSGSFGIVGEAGPELVQGPANITSAAGTANIMAGGGDTHNHYYNINAVDSKSVAQLFAEHRTTLFGNVEQARKELPMRTR
jgi:Lambda phage tail tape-measure protein (Tape_meas_lam_C)